VRRTTTWAAAAAAAVLLAACSGGPDDDPTPGQTQTTAAPEPTDSSEPTPSSTETAAPSPGPDEPDGSEPAFTDSLDAQTAEPEGEPDLVLVDVRVGEHPGFDRVVLEFAGTGTPGYRVHYVDEVVEQGRGDVIDLEGEAYLSIDASGTTYPMEGEEHWDGPRQFEPEDSDVVEEVYVDGTFEGLTVVVAGIDDRAVPFRVLTLTEPSRLVVDIRDTDD
jgi:hypothetical protein